MNYLFISGASRGIGRAITLRFAKNGDFLFLNARKSLDELEEVRKEALALGAGGCVSLPGDIGNPADVRDMFRRVRDLCDGIDILINNAGIAHIGLLSDMSDTQWERVLQTNLSSVFYCCREVIPQMVSKKAGKIINISSIWGTVGASCEVAYSASKSGVNGLTRALAKELAPSNIQVNAISCGVIDTEMNQQLDTEERIALADEIPAGRFGTTEEVAELVFDFSKNHNYLTGQVIGLDGGW